MAEIASVERSIWINAPRERVWQAITTPEQLSVWFSGGTTWEIPTLAVGAQALWHSSETDVDLHIIEALDPPRQFALRWQPEPPTTGRTTTFWLDEENGGTRLRIHETGFDSLPQDQREQAMNGADKGYGEALDNLKTYIERSV